MAVAIYLLLPKPQNLMVNKLSKGKPMSLQKCRNHMNSARSGLKVIHYEINTAQTNLEKEPCKDVAWTEGVFTCEK